MPDIKVSKDPNGHYVISHPTGLTQVMSPEHADGLGVKGLFDSHIKQNTKPKPLKMADGGVVPSFDPEVAGALAGIQTPPSPVPMPPPPAQAGVPLRAPQQVADLAGQQFDAPGAGQVEPALPPQAQPLFAPPKMMETGTQTATSFEKGRTLPATNKQALSDANESQQDAVQNKADVDSAKANEQATVMADTVTAAQKADADLAQREAARQARLDSQLAAYEKSLDDIKKTANQTFWGKQGTSGRVMGGIALALGALGSSMTHGPNVAMEVINKAIDDDFQQQKLDLAKKQDTAQGQLSLYGQMRAKFGDERQADIATKRAMLDNAELKLKSVASKYQSDDTQANAQTAIAGLQEQKAKLDAEFALASQDKITTQQHSTSQLTQAPGTPDPKQIVELPGGGRAFVRNEKDLDKVQEHNAAYQDLKDHLAELHSIQQKIAGGHTALSTDDAARAKQLSAEINMSLPKYKGLNRYTDNEKELQDKYMLALDPTSWYGGRNSGAQLTGLSQIIDSTHKNFLKFNGVVPLGGQQGLPDDPSQMQSIKLVRTGLKK